MIAPMQSTPFDDGFVWGVASSSFQIEGAVDDGGRSSSIWDDFARVPGCIKGGDTGETACDSYNRFADDIGLIGDLGANAYRFSIAWPRVIPSGVGPSNDAGLAYYDRVVDALLARGIEPWVTLYHWDLPSDLEARGGWLNRDIVTWFADYTRAVVERLSDRVSHWFTLNEPQIFLGHGYAIGEHAPGKRLSRKEWLLAAHHALMAHGRSVQIIREAAKKTPVIGWAPVGSVVCPRTADPDEIELARRETFSIGDGNPINNTWYADPVILGHYPEDGLRLYGEDAPAVEPGDMELMCQPIDFYGVNIYSGGLVRRPEENGSAPPRWTERGYPRTMFDWPVRPESLYWGPRFLQERYGLPVYVTENGLASMDWVHADGAVHDAARIDFISRYLGELRRAQADGVDVRGYFHWSILDNFEWAEGYRMRFGLVYVDFETLERVPKDSYRWYQRIIETGGACLPASPVPVR